MPPEKNTPRIQTYCKVKNQTATQCGLCLGHGRPADEKNDALALALRDGWQSRPLSGLTLQVCWECAALIDSDDKLAIKRAHGTRTGKPCAWGAPERGRKPIKRNRRKEA